MFLDLFRLFYDLDDLFLALFICYCIQTLRQYGINLFFDYVVALKRARALKRAGCFCLVCDLV